MNSKLWQVELERRNSLHFTAIMQFRALDFDKDYSFIYAFMIQENVNQHNILKLCIYSFIIFHVIKNHFLPPS